MLRFCFQGGFGNVWIFFILAHTQAYPLTETPSYTPAHTLFFKLTSKFESKIMKLIMRPPHRSAWKHENEKKSAWMREMICIRDAWKTQNFCVNSWKWKINFVNAWNDLHPWCVKNSKFRECVKWHIFVCVLLRAIPIFLSVRECEFKINRRRNHINCLKFLKFSISQDFDYLTLKICIFPTC